MSQERDLFVFKNYILCIEYPDLSMYVCMCGLIEYVCVCMVDYMCECVCVYVCLAVCDKLLGIT